jgi:hypothetical protein
VETFTAPKAFCVNPDFRLQREKQLETLEAAEIDAPVADIVDAFSRLPHCFTLQSCYGHFIYAGQEDPHNLEPLPALAVTARVEYKIAYVALCIDNSSPGRRLREALEEIPGIDPEYIQFGSAEWFWERQVNSFALQVEPDRLKHQDRAVLAWEEALRVERIRNIFFDRIRELLQAPSH